MSNTFDLQFLKKKIFSIKTESDFEDTALRLFNYQASTNEVYQKYMALLNINPGEVSGIAAIPFMPIEFFKQGKIISGSSDHELLFTSSGTTGSSVSRHYIVERSVYEESFLKGFEYFYQS